MCFIIRNNFPDPFIADKDVICYKLLERKLVSPFMHFRYKKRKLYTTDLYIEDRTTRSGIKNDKRIHQGYHSYSRIIDIGIEGIERTHLYKAIIPKGSTFYYDDLHNEFVSTSIKIYGRVGYFHRFLLYLGVIKKFMPEKEKEIEKYIDECLRKK